MSIFKRKKKEEKKDQLEKVEKVKVEKKEEKIEKVSVKGGLASGRKKEKKEFCKTSSRDKKELKHYHGQAYKNIIRPIITEKASFLGMNNQYVFEVATRTNKVEISKAIEKLYGVKPIKINIIKVGGKKVRFGRQFGKMRNWKKAIITLKQGDKIEIYEGV